MARLWHFHSGVTERRKRARGPRLAAIERRGKSRLTVQIDGEVLNRLRNAVYWTPGLTMTGLVERCTADATRSMERRRGEAFPEREEQLKAGRPPR